MYRILLRNIARIKKSIILFQNNHLLFLYLKVITPELHCRRYPLPLVIRLRVPPVLALWVVEDGGLGEVDVVHFDLEEVLWWVDREMVQSEKYDPSVVKLVIVSFFLKLPNL